MNRKRKKSIEKFVNDRPYLSDINRIPTIINSEMDNVIQAKTYYIKCTTLWNVGVKCSFDLLRSLNEKIFLTFLSDYSFKFPFDKYARKTFDKEGDKNHKQLTNGTTKQETDLPTNQYTKQTHNNLIAPKPLTTSQPPNP